MLSKASALIMSPLAVVVLPLFLLQGATAQLPAEQLKGLAYALMDAANDAIKAFNDDGYGRPLNLSNIDGSYVNGSTLYTWYATDGEVLTSGIELIPQVTNLSYIVGGPDGQVQSATHLLQFGVPISFKDMVLKYDTLDFDFRAHADERKLLSAARSLSTKKPIIKQDDLGVISVEVVKNTFNVVFRVLHEYKDQPHDPVCIASVEGITITDFVLKPIQAHVEERIMEEAIDVLVNTIEKKLVDQTNVIPTIEYFILRNYSRFFPFCTSPYTEK